MFGAGGGCTIKTKWHITKKGGTLQKFIPVTCKLVSETRNKNQRYFRPRKRLHERYPLGDIRHSDEKKTLSMLCFSCVYDKRLKPVRYAG